MLSYRGILIILLFLAGAYGCNVNFKSDSDDSLPKPVRKAWQEAHPDIAISDSGESDTNDTAYNITGKRDSVVYDMTIGASGSILKEKTTTFIDKSELPQAVLDSLHARYPQDEGQRFARITENNTETYSVEIVAQEKGALSYTVRINFYPDGRFAGKEWNAGVNF